MKPHLCNTSYIYTCTHPLAHAQGYNYLKHRQLHSYECSSLDSWFSQLYLLEHYKCHYKLAIE